MSITGSTGPIADHAAALDRDMKNLRKTMKGLQIRRGGFKKDHDNLAKAVAKFSVALIEAEALQRTTAKTTRTRTRGGTSATTGGPRAA